MDDAVQKWRRDLNHFSLSTFPQALKACDRSDRSAEDAHSSMAPDPTSEFCRDPCLLSSLAIPFTN